MPASPLTPSPSLPAVEGLRLQLQAARRLVVKVGSQVLCKPTGELDGRTLVRLCQDLAWLMDGGREVVLVSSGAVASGRGALAGAELQGPQTLGKQALAAIGQPLLMARYRGLFEAHGRQVAQILLTHADLADRGRFLHARRVMSELVEAGVLPIVNENDTVAVEELKFGDNDALAAQVAHVVGADALILLTEVEGLYTADPRQDPTATLVPAATWEDEAALQAAGDSKSQLGTGGMRSKVLAARKAGEVGVLTAIASGRTPGSLRQLVAGEAVGTLFLPAPRRLTGKRSWIATSVRPRGTLVVDAGAAQALRSGKRSLLPIGVVQVEGRFEVGDPVQICTTDGQVIARGLTRYASEDARRAAGRRTEQLDEGVLSAEIIHRDDLVLVR